MEVLIDNRQKKYEISLKKVQQKAKAILNALGSTDGELSILIVDDSQIEPLNRKYLDRHGATNVIAFPMHTDQFPNIQPELIGDVVISIETAAREAVMAGISTERRLVQLLVHGILHLFGYNHDGTAQEAKIMEQKTNEILKLIETLVRGQGSGIRY